MDISIVSGTYNRLPYLKRMVQSARVSVLPPNITGLKYEFVLVDGGSTDGTIEWCHSQDDIRLIQHGELLGAVKAFNDGAYASRGKYVILANDDIEFVSDSIFTAYLYMEQHPDCGGGCFFQDRDGKDWHVDMMSATTLDKKPVHVHYAQVGIFQKWLGDHVGWWCRDDNFAANLNDDDFRRIKDAKVGLHTYGGDNELSCCIIDIGYKVTPIPGAKITDKEADDGLRAINNIGGAKDPKSIQGHHPDSWKWNHRWFRRNAKIGYHQCAGPIIKDTIMVEAPERIKKDVVLYLPLFEQGWAVQKEQKRGLRDALGKVAVTYEYDYMTRVNEIGKPKMMQELYKLCERIKPTIVLTQLHNGDVINGGDIGNLRKNCPDGTKFINWNGDYWPDQLLNSDGIKLAKAFDIATVVNRDVVEKHTKQGINTRYWQIGWEPDGRGHNPEVYHDIVFLASGYSAKRQQLGSFLTGLNYNVGIYGSGWPNGVSKGQNLYNFREACKVYRGAKIAIGDSQWPNSGFVSNRIMQILTAGNCVLCHQWFRGYENLGLVDGNNCIIWHNYGDLAARLNFWLAPQNSHHLQGLAVRGTDLAVTSHSFDSRVTELWQMLDINTNIVNWRW